MPVEWQYALYALPPFLAGTIALLGASIAWRRQRVAAGTLYFALFCLAAAVWSIGYGLEIMSPAVRGKLLWSRVEYLGIGSVSIFYLCFALRFAGHGSWLTRPRQALLWVIPVLSVLLMWTTPLHDLYYRSVGLLSDGMLFPVLDIDYGPAFWVLFGYNYLLLALTTFLLGRVVARHHVLFSRQALALLAALVVPWAFNLGSLLARLMHVPLVGGINLTPIGFAISGAVVVWGLYGLRVLDVIPAAFDRVFNQMQGAVFILDADGNIIDANPAAEDVASLPAAAMIGRPAREVVPCRTGAFTDLLEIVGRQREMIIGEDPARTFLVNVSELRRRGRVFGYVATLHDITERRLAEDLLRQSEARYRLLAEYATDLITRHTPDGTFTYVSPSVRTLLGYQQSDLLGCPAYDFFHPDDQAAIRESHHSVLEGPEISTAEGRFRRQDGTYTWLETTSRAIRDQKTGDVSEIIAASRDVSERRRMEEIEREQRQFAEALRETAAALNSTLDLDGVFNHILESVGRVVSHSASNIMLIEDGVARVVGWHSYEGRASDEDLRALRLPVAQASNLQHMVDTGEPYIVSDIRAFPDWLDTPATTWMRSYAGAPIRLEGETIGFINLDSEQLDFFTAEHAERLKVFAEQAALAIKNARLYGESERRNQQLALLNRITRIGAEVRELDDLLQTLADSAAEIVGGDGCYITLWDLRNNRVIPSAANGDERDTYRQLRVEPDEKTLTQTVLETGKPLAVDDVFDTPHVSRHIAERFPERSVLALPLQSDERSIGALLIGFHEKHHFTPAEVAWAAQAAELIALAIDKAQAYAELKARNEELDAFSHTVAHDLKAPLAALAGYLELLTADLQDDLSVDHRHMLERARTSAFRQNQIIESLLMLAQLRKVDQPLDRVSPRGVAVMAADRFRDQIEERGIEVTVAETMPAVMGFGPWLEEVFANLISNAVKYIGKQNVKPTITIQARALDDKMVRFEVIDNGLRISVEDQNSLFEMFSRHHTEEASGLGLGLSIVSRVIARLDGQLGVESEEGHGSTFWFTLPLAETESMPEISD